MVMLQKAYWNFPTIVMVFAAQGWAAEPEFFPMSKGTYWIYRGQVSWEVDGKVESRRIQWRMEIIDRIQRDDATVAVLKGHPADLAWYSPAQARGDYLLVKSSENRFYLVHGEPYFEQLLGRAKDPKQPMDDLLTRRDLVLQLPLNNDTRFGEEDQLNRPDKMNAWTVESIERTRLSGVRGAPRGEHPQYTVALLTNPDHTFISYVAGVGITSYVYGHHGTVSSTSVKLVRFHRAAD